MEEWKKFVIEIGFGIDQHGQDPTNAAVKAIKDAISRAYLVGILEFGFSKIKIEALIGVPYSEKVNVDELKEVFPLKTEIDVKIINGGLLYGGGVLMKEFQDKTQEIIIANALIIVYVAK